MLVIFDTETTGFKNNHLVELAAIILPPNGEILTYHSRCKPSSNIEDGAAAVHGITDFMVQDERSDVEVFNEFWADIYGIYDPAQGPLVLGGHNSAFDMRVMRKYAPISADIPVLCTMKLGRLYSPESENHKLTTLHAHLKCTGNYQAHAALDDCWMSFDILKHYMSTLGMGYLDLAKGQSKPVILKTVPFGKHKGESFTTVPVSYMNYMLGMSDLDPDVAYNFRQELARRAA
jgi:DNA polymerase III epsilon subunit-like protein